MNLVGINNDQIRTPNNLAICLDFVSCWGAEPNRAQLGRLCAGSIGVCFDHLAVLPKYKSKDGNPLEYGGKVLERLLGNGFTPGKIYELGATCLFEMAKAIPTEAEVESTADFLPTPPQGRSEDSV